MFPNCLRVLSHRHFWCAPGFDWRFVWMMWMLSSDLRWAPANRTRVRLKRVVWGSVQVNSGTVRCWCECNRTKSWKWTDINDVLFDKKIGLCVFHSLSSRAWLTRSKQALYLISVRLQGALVHFQYIRKTDVSAVMYWSFGNKTNGSKCQYINRTRVRTRQSNQLWKHI